MPAADSVRTLNDRPGRVCVVGSLNVDLTVHTERMPVPGETLRGGELGILPGGKSANQAAAAGFAGAKVDMLGAAGSDANGDLVLGFLNRAGVDTSHVHRVDAPTGTAIITVADGGENTIVTSAGANAAVDVAMVEAEADLIAGADIVGLGLEINIEAVTRAAQIAHEAGVPVLVNLSPYQESLPTDLLDATDILVVNETELAQLLAESAASRNVNIRVPDDAHSSYWPLILSELASRGFTRTAVTMGGKGAVILDAHSDRSVSPIEPTRVEVVDTTGAGDCFMGTLLAGFAADLTPGEAARLANRAAAASTTRWGAMTSYLPIAEILAEEPPA